MPNTGRDERSPHRAAAASAAGCALVLLLAGCDGGNGQSTLHPESDQSRQIAHLWWGMLAAAAVVFAGAVALLTIAWFRRGRAGLPVVGKQDEVSTVLVVLFGIAIPVSALVVLFFVSNIGVVRATDAPKPGQTKMDVTVIGHQWFWEVRYPGTPAVTANEIHIPVRTPVKVTVESADVVHSFWVPELNKKIDVLPAHRNTLELYADHVGAYRGQCAEFCGLQHAHMAMAVYADPAPRFRAWLANMSRPLRPPSSPPARSGERVFLTQQCASCHTIRGTAARGTIGPDLTHLATRRTIAALTAPGDRAHLADWVANPQRLKPGNKMPGLNLTGAQLRQVVSFLEGLR